MFFLIGFVAGVIAGISPCVLPVLPVIFVAGATGGGAVGEAPTEVGEVMARRRLQTLRRPLAVIAGLVLSFGAFTLAGTALLTALHLPQDLLRDLGIAVLALLGLGLVVPGVGHLLERPFSHIRLRQPVGAVSGFLLGVGLGGVFVPCAGPVLAAITVVGATHRFGPASVLLTLAFSAGAALPLLVVALAGGQMAARVRRLRTRARALRLCGGLVLLAMALVIGLNWTAGLQEAVPGYTSALQRDVEGSAYASAHLQALTGVSTSRLSDCTSDAPRLSDCGPAPAFAGVTAWVNTGRGGPPTIAGLRHKVVLVDFWTYSCINCERAIPHVEAWYRRYGPDGLVVVGVHTPEFAFEHVVANVIQATHRLGVSYPVAVDDAYDTWNAYDNQYWPAEYLIDGDGVVRHVAFGEGDYARTEALIRALLREADPRVVLPPATEVPDATPTEALSPETYVGYERLQYLIGANVVEDRPAVYHPPAFVPVGFFALSGTWKVGGEAATAVSGSSLELDYQAKDVYLVMGGSGKVTVAVPGELTRAIRVEGIPRLYTLTSSPALTDATLTLGATPGVEVYDFTFG